MANHDVSKVISQGEAQTQTYRLQDNLSMKEGNKNASSILSESFNKESHSEMTAFFEQASKGSSYLPSLKANQNAMPPVTDCFSVEYPNLGPKSMIVSLVKVH